MPVPIEGAPNPETPDVIPGIRLFGVVGTWMEEDVIAAAVRNALIQGCERVYVVDNGSTDDTIANARAAGATLARIFETPRYDETLRLGHMTEVAAEVSRAEPDEHLWWMFMDGDEFSHGPSGMTLHEYIRTLDRRFRVIGVRCFDHYPSAMPAYVRGRHPLDYQPLCHELAFSMCPRYHRKHPLIRFDRTGPSLKPGNGFHLVEGTDSVYEPLEPAFLHHFPYRDERVTRSRLEMLWAKDACGVTRATEERDTHMLARIRSLAAVYARRWEDVVNFVALDPLYKDVDPPLPATGVGLKPWAEQVEAGHQPILRWYSMVDAWRYEQLPRFRYGDDTTYVRGLQFLDGQGVIEDWGCGFAHARQFVRLSKYIGIDGSSPYADRIADLSAYRSTPECIFMRHVLEHNPQWRAVLTNALRSFTRRMVLIIFTPFGETTRVIATTVENMTSIPIPDISFRKSDVVDMLRAVRFREESLRTDTQYGCEHVFYLEK